jgi:hypothetical protein
MVLKGDKLSTKILLKLKISENEQYKRVHRHLIKH